MWCGLCQQDRPGIVSLEDDRLVWCARCNGLMTSVAGVDRGSDGCRDATSAKPKTQWLDSPMAIGLDYLRDRELPSPSEVEVFSHRDGWLTPSRRVWSVADSLIPAGQRRWMLMVGWLCMSTGLAGQLVVAVIMGWNLLSGASDFWVTGILTMLTSQLLLLMGFLFHHDHVGYRQRAAESSLRQLTSQWTLLQEAVERLSRAAEPPRFYEITESSVEVDPKTVDSMWQDRRHGPSRESVKRDAA